jgi:hypothetical protein
MIVLLWVLLYVGCLICRTEISISVDWDHFEKFLRFSCDALKHPSDHSDWTFSDHIVSIGHVIIFQHLSCYYFLNLVDQRCPR